MDSQGDSHFEEPTEGMEEEEEEEPRALWLSRYVIYPGWTTKLVWDLAVMTIVLMDAFVLPVQLSFKRDYGEDAFDDVWFWVTTICFTLDILVTFDTGLTVAGAASSMLSDDSPFFKEAAHQSTR